MLKIYILPSSHSSRKAVAWLTEVGQPFEVQNMSTSRLTFEQLKDILSYTENGVDDIIANGREKVMLAEEGVDLNEITLSELYYYIKRFPRLVKAPIAIWKGKMTIGYSPEEYEVHRPRTSRLEAYFEQLEEMRAIEDIKLAEGKKVSAGHWG
jgi:regulatory protein spx